MERKQTLKSAIYNLYLKNWKYAELSYRFGIPENEIREIIKDLKGNKNIRA